MGRVAFAGGPDDQILCHRHHDGKCLAGASARSHAGCHCAGLLGRLAWENSVPESTVNALLGPYPDNAMAFWAVDRRVGNVRNDSPDLFAPLAAQR